MTTTPETPSDEELSRLYYAGLTENGRENRTTVAAGNDARRALWNDGFTRGERRGIERIAPRLDELRRSVNEIAKNHVPCSPLASRIENELAEILESLREPAAVEKPDSSGPGSPTDREANRLALLRAAEVTAALSGASPGSSQYPWGAATPSEKLLGAILLIVDVALSEVAEEHKRALTVAKLGIERVCQDLQSRELRG